MPDEQREGDCCVPSHMTLVCCIAADGTDITPLLILDIKTVHPGLIDKSIGFTITGSDSGWITGNIFKMWVSDVFIPEIQMRRDQDVLRMLRDNNISLLTLPAHSSHFLQPLDVCPFGIFKKKLHNSVVFDAKDNMLLRRRKLA